MTSSIEWTDRDPSERYGLDWLKTVLVNAGLVDAAMLPLVVDDALLATDLHLDSLAFLELHAVLAEQFDGWSPPRQLDLSATTVRDVLHYCRLAAVQEVG